MAMPIRRKSIDSMSYADMLIEIQNVRERLQDKSISHEERIDLYKYLKKLDKEIYDFEEFQKIPHKNPI